MVDTLDLALIRPTTTTIHGFVFADLRAHGRGRAVPTDAGAELRVRFRGIVHAAARRHGALDLTAVGDGFYLVLPSSRAAVRCARSILAVASHPTDGAEPLRVGVGVHSADVDRREPRPLDGPGHLAARIGAVAPSGDVLVTAATVEQLGRTAGVRFEPRTLPPLKGLPIAPTVFAAVGETSSIGGAGRVARLFAMGSLAGLFGLAAVAGFGGPPAGIVDRPLDGDGGVVLATQPPDLVAPGQGDGVGAAGAEPADDPGPEGTTGPAASSDPAVGPPWLHIHLPLRSR